MKTKIILLICLIFLLTAPIMTVHVLADESIDPAVPEGVNELNTDHTTNPSTQTVLQNPLGNVNNVSQLYGRIIYAFLGLSGAVALIMFILGGFSWMTAQGNEEKIKKGRDTLIWAVLGLIVIFSSYAVLRTIFETLTF